MIGLKFKLQHERFPFQFLLWGVGLFCWASCRLGAEGLCPWLLLLLLLQSALLFNKHTKVNVHCIISVPVKLFISNQRVFFCLVGWFEGVLCYCPSHQEKRQSCESVNPGHCSFSKFKLQRNFDFISFFFLPPSPSFAFLRLLV